MGYINGIAILACINMVAVCGVIILTGYTGLFSLGHAGLVAIGAYSAGILAKYYHVHFVPAILLGGFFSIAASLIVGYPTLRGRLKGDYFAIAMMGFAEGVRLLLANIYPLVGGATGLIGIPRESTLPVTAAFAAVFIFLTVNYVRSQHGRLALSIREQEVAAELIGVNVTKEKMKSLMISAYFAGVAGGLFGMYYGFITPNTFSANMSNDLLASVVFGGMGGVSGPVIASVLLTALPEFLRVVDRWRLVIYGLAMVIIMLFKPEGLLGSREISLVALYRAISRAWAKRMAKKEAAR